MERREIYYSGHVQGVGFRYTTRNIAHRHNVTGEVRNLPDGRVRLILEGDSEEIDGLLGEVRRALGRHIRDIQSETLPATGHFSDFSIGY